MELGVNPDHNTKEFKKFQLSHLGQHAPPIFKALSMGLVAPCTLHCILALHRYMWKHVSTVIAEREQEMRIPDALKKTGANYFAFQYASFLKSKMFDGNANLKWTGTDCKRLENKINLFFHLLLEMGR